MNEQSNAASNNGGSNGPEWAGSPRSGPFQKEPTFRTGPDPKVTFYHDTGGATFDRETVVANTRKYIYGKVKHELIPTTFFVSN